MARGLSTPKRRLSEDAVAALACGDIDELLRINHVEFGSSVMMADDDDDEDDDDDDNPDSGGEDDDDDDDVKSKGKKKSKDDSEDDDDDDVAAELAAMRKRMKAADKRADEAAARVRELERKDTPEAQKAKEDLQEANTKVKTLTETVNALRLENAFLTANEQAWHDPDVALSIAQSKGYLDDVVDEDGDVDRKGLKSALKRLAKEHKYLVAGEKSKKREDDSDDEDDDDDDLPESGSSAGRRSDNQRDGKARRQQLQSRFPVLNR